MVVTSTGSDVKQYLFERINFEREIHEKWKAENEGAECPEEHKRAWDTFLTGYLEALRVLENVVTNA